MPNPPINRTSLAIVEPPAPARAPVGPTLTVDGQPLVAGTYERDADGTLRLISRTVEAAREPKRAAPVRNGPGEAA